MKLILRNILLGLLAWLIPFVAAFPFYTAEGELRTDLILFKTVMLIVGSIAGAGLFIWFFKPIKKQYLKYGFIAGLNWMIISWLLDLAILLPMSDDMGFSQYVQEIGLRYIPMFVTGITIGYLLQRHSK